MQPRDQTGAGDALRRELARGDLALAGVAPVLTHLLGSPGQALVSEDVLARMRGMLMDLSQQLLAAQVEISGEALTAAPAGNEALVGKLASSGIVVSHCYAVAMESQLGAQLEQSGAIDQVLTPLLQELIASSDEATAELAMKTMSAQARFVQAQRRMDLPLVELPAELFVEVLALARSEDLPGTEHDKARAEALLRDKYDESASRLGLLVRLVGRLARGMHAALDLEHAGVALFATALGKASHQPRELAVLSCHERQAVRFGLALRAAGLKPDQIERQFVLVHRDLPAPRGLDEITSERAAAFLKGTVAGRGS